LAAATDVFHANAFSRLSASSDRPIVNAALTALISGQIRHRFCCWFTRNGSDAGLAVRRLGAASLAAMSDCVLAG